jgi:hypothetical protein
MSSKLWVPLNRQPKPACIPEERDLKLADGRILAFQYRRQYEAAKNVWQFQFWWQTGDGMGVCASEDESPHGNLLHVSLSYPDHLPTWEEIKAVKGLFFGDGVDAMMMLPRKELYVSHHPYAMHIWQCPVGWEVA